MKKNTMLLTAVWVISLAAAFIIGSNIHTNGPAQQEVTADSPATARSASRSSSRSGSTASTRNRRSGVAESSAAKQSIASIMANGNSLERTRAMLDFISKMGAGDFEQSVAEFRALGIAGNRLHEYTMLLHAWAKADPLAALGYATTNTKSEFATQAILAGWAGYDVQSALDWARGNHEGEDANPWLVGVVRGIADSDPAKATEIMATLPYGRDRGQAMLAIVPHIARQGKEKTYAWLETITDPRLRAGGASYLAQTMVAADPAAAAAWTLGLNEQDAAAAAKMVARGFAATDLDAAVSWVGSLPEKAKMDAAVSMVGEYAKKDPVKAADWATSMSDQPGYQKLLNSYFVSASKSHPQIAIDQIPRLTQNETQRRFYYDNAFINWLRTDRAAAGKWMDRNPDSVSARMRDRKVKGDK